MSQMSTEFRARTADAETSPASLDHPDELLIPAANSSSISPGPSYPPLVRKNPEWLIRKILVPTDYSYESTNALRRAVAIANQCAATLTILHVIDVNAQGKPGAAEDMMKQLWKEGSTQMAHLACSLAGQVEAQTMLAEGLPWEVIMEKSCEFDLVVIGKGRNRRHWKLFSRHTARRVMENAACPVMVVADQN